MAVMIKERSEALPKDCWDVTKMYLTWDLWESDFSEVKKNIESKEKWSSFNLSDVEKLKFFLDSLMEMERKIEFLYTYTHLRHDEDLAENVAKKKHLECLNTIQLFKEQLSWFEPCLLQLDPQILKGFLEEPILQEYWVFLGKIIRMKSHTLNESEEKILAFSTKALEASRRAFSSLNNVDLRFPDCLDREGNSHPLTHGMYGVYIKSQDRTLRKEAFLKMLESFKGYENTFCDLLQGQVDSMIFYSRSRKFDSCLESALYPHQINQDVYHNLIETGKVGLKSLHRYLELRKKWMGLSEMHLYDLSASIVDEVELKISYEDAVSKIIDSVSVLGEEYQEVLKKGLLEDRWVDRYENQRKRSGAYSSGCYGSVPYILMNYHGLLDDAMTLTHEAGHSMHSYYSTKYQKFQDASYSIFVAEVASTFHEELLFRKLLEDVQTAEERAYLLSQKINGIRATFFRQMMFAEFELFIYSSVEKGEPLTPETLRKKYLDLNVEYFGTAVFIDPEIASEWSRIPHFYYGFYVYQYATGISAACSLAKDVVKGGDFPRRYLDFLSTGSSLPPLEALQKAGVDMAQKKPIVALITYFNELVEMLEKNMEEIQKKVDLKS